LPPADEQALLDGLGPLAFPVFIPTRGRPQTQLTAAKLIAMGVRPVLVIPPDDPVEVDRYAALNPDALVIPYHPAYFTHYERTPELEPHPTTGAAHNFAWDYARAAGFSHHWIMDDNIKYFWWRTAADVPSQRPKAGERRKGVRYAEACHFAQMESTARGFANLAGLSLGQGGTFSDKPFMVNTRLYCATLYRNDLDLPPWNIQWRRGLNDDTVVSLDILKTLYFCTAESRLLGIAKVPTSRGKRLQGGMTEFYARQGGFKLKAAEAIRLHPDCVRESVRFGRIHHHISYSQFHQRLMKYPSPSDIPPSHTPREATE